MSKAIKDKKNEAVAASKFMWHFPDLDHGEADEFADPLLQYFEGDHERFIARETIQNSIDARFDQEKPVKIVFEKFNMRMSDIPGYAELKERAKACLEQTSDKDTKAKSHFKEFLMLFEKPEVSVLRIADHNTSGLDGADNDKDGKWYRLVKAVGANRMSGVGGGSFGIGKGAPFAASSIRTVLYSTLNSNSEVIFQGKTRLVSHEYSGKEKRGTGFYGINGFESIRDAKLVPQRFLRTEQGTDVFIIGYASDKPDWKAELAKSVVDNFWMALHSGDLEVVLQNGKDHLEINQASLHENLQIYSRDDAWPYYLAVVSPTKATSAQLATIGSCKLFIRQEAGFSKDIALMRRSKMVVKKKHYRMQDGYAGVFLCDDVEGNKLLRELEPPQHDNWDPNRDKERGVKIIREINDWVKGVLKEIANSGAGDPEEIPGLDQFLPYDEDSDVPESGSPMTPSDGSLKEESWREIGAEKEEKEEEVEDYIQRSSMLNIGSGSDAGPSYGGENKTDTGKEGAGAGSNEGAALSRIDTSQIRFRAIALKEEKPGTWEYCLIIDPLSDQSGAINIVGVGDDNNYPLNLRYAKEWKNEKKVSVRQSFIENLKFKKGQQVRIRVGVASHTRYAVGIESYEN